MWIASHRSKKKKKASERRVVQYQNQNAWIPRVREEGRAEGWRTGVDCGATTSPHEEDRSEELVRHFSCLPSWDGVGRAFRVQGCRADQFWGFLHNVPELPVDVYAARPQ